jgi:hypothetical protein
MVATILVRRIAGIVCDRLISDVTGVPPPPDAGGFLGAALAARGVRGRVRTIPVMLGPSRPLPRVGARARIAHFGGGFEGGAVIAVRDGGRRVEVEGDGGEVLEFVLSPSSARFVSVAGVHGPRLELLG